VLQAHEQLQNKVIDAQQPPEQNATEEEEQQQQQQHEVCRSWQDNLQLQHVTPGHRAYQVAEQQQGSKGVEKKRQQQQQPLCALSTRQFSPGDFIGFYLSNVLDDNMYDLGNSIEERAYRQYIHKFTFEQPALALRC
jgi:hypothetical protein